MGLKNLFDDVFEDSEEELKADIKEAQELIKEREKQLEEVIKRKMQKKTKVHHTKPKKKKSSIADYLYFAVPLVLAVVIIIIGISLSGSQEAEQSIYCEGDPECPDCEIVVSCLDISDEEINFRLTNQLNADGECIVDVIYSQEDILIDKKTYAIGNVDAKETVKTTVPIEMPSGKTSISILPTCEW